MMKRMTIIVPENLKVRAKRRAKKLGISLSELVCGILITTLNSKARSEDPLFADSVVYDGPAPEDGAINHDRYIYGPDCV